MTLGSCMTRLAAGRYPRLRQHLASRDARHDPRVATAELG
jgi:hypothetical protein